MTIDGAQVMIFSQNADADREFVRDVLQIPSIDSGGGWLIFKLPPAELGVHPAGSNDRHELYLMCSDIELLIENLAARDVRCAVPIDEARGQAHPCPAARRRHRWRVPAAASPRRIVTVIQQCSDT